MAKIMFQAMVIMAMLSFPGMAAKADYFEVTAYGTANPKDALSQAHALTLALKTARHLAYEKLLEQIKGVDVSETAGYKNETLKKSRLNVASQSFIKGARVVDQDFAVLSDGSVLASITLGIDIPDQKRHIFPDPFSPQPSNQQMHQPPPTPHKTPAPSSGKNLKSQQPASAPKSTPEMNYTSLIVDARGLDIQRTDYPEIFSSEGDGIYNLNVVSAPESLLKQYVTYARSIEQAMSMDRAGDCPLTVTADSVYDGANLIIAQPVAEIIWEADSAVKFLEKCRVIIVADI